MPKTFDSVEALQKEISNLRKNKKLVFTNGCFDVLHPGHIYFLEQAASLGDMLVVGLNDDSSVKKIKGNDRPVNNKQVRVEMLSALKTVDYIVLFSEETPYRLIKELKPDFLVKGEEYGKGEIIGEDIAKKTVRIKMKPGYSTTEILKNQKARVNGMNGYGKQ